MNSRAHDQLMRDAIAVCRDGIAAGQAPFGAVIAAADGRVVHAAHNTVRQTGDPTAHAEINAIRAACVALSTIDLSGCVIATTCEPCPMCAAAIHWARLDAVIFGATIADATAAGFGELTVSAGRLYEMGGSSVAVHGGVLQAESAELFQMWLRGPSPTPY